MRAHAAAGRGTDEGNARKGNSGGGSSTGSTWTAERKEGRVLYRCIGYNGECSECRPQTAGGNWAKHHLTVKEMAQRGTDKRFCGECKIPTVEAEVDAEADAEADA